MNKKKSETNKTSYRPVLSNFSKLYEKLMYKKFYQHFETIWFSSQYGFRKGYSAQDCLLMMAKKLKKQLIMIMNSVHFWLIFQKHLIALITHYYLQNVMGMECYIYRLKLIFSYFESLTRRTKIKNYFSKPSKIDSGVLQVSIQGSLLFSISLIDVFNDCEDSGIEKYADDTKSDTYSWYRYINL